MWSISDDSDGLLGRRCDVTERMAAPVGLRGRSPTIFRVGDGIADDEALLLLVTAVNVWRSLAVPLPSSRDVVRGVCSVDAVVMVSVHDDVSIIQSLCRG